jgi:hypothetical protein
MLLLRADTESDPAAKRGRLERVAGAQSVDASLRKTASDRLAALDEPGAIALMAPDAGKSPTGTMARAGTTPPSSPSRPSQRPPSFEVERTLALSSSPADVQRARELLEPRVLGSKASQEEVRLLEAVCKQQHDVLCTRQCKSLETGGGP